MRLHPSKIKVGQNIGGGMIHMTYWDWEILFFIFFAVAMLGILYYPYLVNPQRRKKAPKVEPQDMNEIQRQGILYGAYISSRNNDNPFDSLAAKINYVNYKRMLRRDWGIKNRESAIWELNSLAELRMVIQLDQVLRTDFASQTKVIDRVTKKLGYCPYQHSEEFSTYAWDVGRLSSVAKWCFWQGYITEEELNEYYKICIDIVANLGKDWDEFTYSYLLGRSMHGFSMQEMPKIIKAVLPQLKQHPFKIEIN